MRVWLLEAKPILAPSSISETRGYRKRALIDSRCPQGVWFASRAIRARQGPLYQPIRRIDPGASQGASRVNQRLLECRASQPAQTPYFDIRPGCRSGRVRPGCRSGMEQPGPTCKVAGRAGLLGSGFGRVPYLGRVASNAEALARIFEPTIRPMVIAGTNL
jgi:hypothetical protein